MMRGILSVAAALAVLVIAGCTAPTSTPDPPSSVECFTDVDGVTGGEPGDPVAWPVDLQDGIDPEPTCWGRVAGDVPQFLAEWHLADAEAAGEVADDLAAQLILRGYTADAVGEVWTSEGRRVVVAWTGSVVTVNASGEAGTDGPSVGAPVVGECFPESATEEFIGQPPGWVPPLPENGFTVDPACWTAGDGGLPMSAIWWGVESDVAESEARRSLADLPETSPGVFDRTQVLFTLTRDGDLFRLDVRRADDA